MSLKQLELQNLRDMQDQLARAVRRAVTAAAGGVDAGPLAFNAIAAERFLQSESLSRPSLSRAESLSQLASIDSIRGLDFYSRFRVLRRILDPAADSWMRAEVSKTSSPEIMVKWRKERFGAACMLIGELEAEGRKLSAKWRAEADSSGVHPWTIIWETLKFKLEIKKLYLAARRIGASSVNSNGTLEAIMIQLVDAGLAHGQ